MLRGHYLLSETVTPCFVSWLRLSRQFRLVSYNVHMCESGDWFLLHDNAPSHNATIVKQFLAQRKVTVLDHLPYSPDLAPADYFLFPKVKSHLKRCLFDSISDIQKSSDKYIKHHCKGGLLQSHPETVWPCKSVCRVRRDVCQKLLRADWS